MRKPTRTLFLVLIGLLTLISCGGKKSETGLSSKTELPGSSLLPSSKPFEGILTMRTTIPKAGSTEIKLFIAKEGVRTETTPHMKNMPTGLQMAMFSPSAAPNLVYFINDKQKTYSVLDTDSIRQRIAGADSLDSYKDAKIENLGMETVNGYNCTHVRITRGKRVTEMWVSKEILDYFTYARMQSAKDRDIPELAKRMKAAGLDGFPVKTWNPEANITTELTGVEKKGLDAALFKVPEGYAKTEMPMMNAGPSPGASREVDAMMKKMQEQMKGRQNQLK
jgi:hypothetical protein